LKSADADRRKLQLEVIKVAAELLGSAFFLVTLVVGWGQLKNTQDQLEVAREGQVTERFTRAVDQIGSAEVTVRVGGIYALEGVARDSPVNRPAVLDVLASFLRERSPVTVPVSERDWRAARGLRPPADIQAAATVIGRRNTEGEANTDQPCDELGGPNFPCKLSLEDVDFSGLTLTSMDFGQMSFRGSVFNSTNLAFTSFASSDLAFTDLRGANLRLADLTDARLQASELESANLHLVTGLTCEQLRIAAANGAGAANLTITCPEPPGSPPTRAGSPAPRSR
jgi:hypothetical protein